MRLLFLSLFVATWCGPVLKVHSVASEVASVPQVPREFRAAWVATVANIDWPSQPGLTTEQQQKEMLAILDRAVALNLNAIIFQVRPHCDALYASDLEPWSEYLTGTMGQAPAPYYDPLEFVVREAHARGLELHAWFNPYRASHPVAKSELADSHVSKSQPQMVREYGKHLWLDPGAKESADHSLKVIMDVVRRYDVDGIHFDDYFYPYPINDEDGKRVDFPDELSWEVAKTNGEQLSRQDWRRKNVDEFIGRVYRAIKAEKKWVKFGISPFGIWRPGHPKSIRGFDAYENLYADARKWFREGTVDYLTPQLYWAVAKKSLSFPVLLGWWAEQNAKGRHLWPGHFTSRVGNKELENWKPEEIALQIDLTRKEKGATGNVHFSMVVLMKDERGMAELLSKETYQQPALVPASPWLEDSVPEPPVATRQGMSLTLRAEVEPWLWVIQVKSSTGWKTSILPGDHQLCELSELGSSHDVTLVAVSAVHRCGGKSVPQLIVIQEQ